MKALWECQRWWVAPLSKIATSMSVAAAAAKMLVGLAEITCARAEENLGGRAKQTNAILLMVESRRVTTLLVSGVMVGGGRIALPLMRMVAHAYAKEEDEVLGAPLALVVGSATPAAATDRTSLI